MKTNQKALKLIELGLTAKTVLNLSESQIDILFEKFNLNEEVTMVKSNNKAEIDSLKNQGKTFQVYEKEVTEDEEDPMDFEKGERTQDPHQVGPSTDDGFDGYGDGMPTEGEIQEKKKDYNPWAICTSTMGKEFGTTERSEWSKAETNKYERCVKDVKKSIKEGKNPYHLFIEKEIVSLVERTLTPKMTKKDLLNTILEEPTETPTKPKTKPGVKPDTKPRTRPSHPGKNPNPGENPSPKAEDLEKAKDEVMDIIKKLLQNGKK